MADRHVLGITRAPLSSADKYRAQPRNQIASGALHPAFFEDCHVPRALHARCAPPPFPTKICSLTTAVESVLTVCRKRATQSTARTGTHQNTIKAADCAQTFEEPSSDTWASDCTNQLLSSPMDHRTTPCVPPVWAGLQLPIASPLSGRATCTT